MSEAQGCSQSRRTVLEALATQVLRAPASHAVISSAGVLTYRELSELSDQVAYRLRAQGIRSLDRVALCAERSTSLIAAVLGVLKAGATFVPFDAGWPDARITRMLDVADISLVLCERHLLDRFAAAGIPVEVLESVVVGDAPVLRDEALPVVGPDDPAYIMFTSGSTGEPKGVVVPHRAITRLVCDVDYVVLGPEQSVLHAAPLAFDASTFEVFGALLTGGRLALHPERVPTAAGLAQSIQAFSVTTMWLTAGLFNAVIDEAPHALRGVQQLLVGGEALSVAHIRRAQAALPGTQLINGYGPTETTTFAATYRIPSPLADDVTSIPIGFPIRATTLHVLGESRLPVRAGEVGELHVGGDGVALGYAGRPDLTAERFLPDPFASSNDALMYRTGDLVRVDASGALLFLGRADRQVKLRGYRIELGEIEAALRGHPAVRDCVVAARASGESGEQRLVAWIVTSTTSPAPNASELRAFLAPSLPLYMIPTTFASVAALPLSATGKVDLAALPDPPRLVEALRAEGGAANGATRPVAPNDARIDERAIAAVCAELLGVPALPPLASLFELGFTSLTVVRAVERLRRQGISVTALQFFEHRSVREVARSLRPPPVHDAVHGGESRQASAHQGHPGGARDVAIVGMAARLPGAATLDEYWDNLRAGTESITRFSEQALDPSVAESLRRDPDYVRARGVVEGVEMLDAEFFGISPREAQLMDPQQRVFLEVAWEALEHAGCIPQRFAGTIGVYAGVYNVAYGAMIHARRPDLVERFGAFNTMLLNEKDYVAVRAAHRLGLTGPAISVHTACSTSLVALCQAVQGLRDGSCDAAIAGGVSLTLPTRSGYLHQEGSMLSPDGSTRPFDSESGGTVFSDGAGVVVLKRLEDAERDRDTIYAIVRGVGVNNDGSDKASFSAPSVSGQAAVIARAHRDAGVRPREIDYVEAHGTATPLGDPIEVEALTRVFRADTSDVGFCKLGSAKSNIGHTVIAAGAAGVIKTALALHHQELPATLHFRTPNPAIKLIEGPFRVASAHSSWPRSELRTRRAGVSSFGVGGTNAHVVLEEAPAHVPTRPHSGPYLLPLSARTPAALAAAADRLAAHLERCPELSLADVEFTLQHGRREFAHRRVVVASSREEAVARLRAPDAKAPARTVSPDATPTLAFLFPGQGAQYPRMGSALYDDDRAFRAVMDRCADVVLAEGGVDLRALLYQAPFDEASTLLRSTAHTQPALYATELALAEYWMSRGLRPDVLVGHSVGEFACAALAGVFSYEDGMRMVLERGRLMDAQPPGAMLSVRLSASEVERRMGPALSLAAENGPALSVVAGPFEAIEELQRALESEGVVSRVLHTSHAFHSSMMEPVVHGMAQVAGRIALQAPRIPIVSTVTGDWATAEQWRDPGYWARQVRLPVRFQAAIRTLVEGMESVACLEVGPRDVLTTFVRQHPLARGRTACVASLGSSADSSGGAAAICQATGALWSSGVPLDWARFSPLDSARRVALPSYPFERSRYWVDPVEEPTPVMQERVGTLPAQGAGESPPPSTHAMPVMPSNRLEHLTSEVRTILEQQSGAEIGAADIDTSFMQLGFDSLLLTQAALSLSKRFKTKLTFRQLQEQFTTSRAVAEYLDQVLPVERDAAAARAPEPVPSRVAAPTAATVPVQGGSAPAATGSEMMRQVIDHQLRIMAEQLRVLGGNAATTVGSAPHGGIDVSGAASVGVASSDGSPALESPLASVASNGTGRDTALVPSTGPQREFYDASKAFGAAPRITHAVGTELTPKQRSRLDAFIRRYNARTHGSRTFTQEHRAHMADPRVATGFRPLVKELVYPIVVERSRGSRFWDVDGNEYIDLLSGFGSNLLGWTHPAVTEAVKAQLDAGFEVGPQHPLTAELTALVQEFTGAERVAFCNTGSEAVLGAIRIARTVTGRNLIVLFTGSYHGINDEVIVRARRDGQALPAAPGILPSTAENVLVLEYGTPESLAVIRERSDEIAAVLVEPVQSRRPDFQPVEFLRDLRQLTEERDILYIWDEIVTGFRVAPGGAQEHFQIRADLATYGKVMGGGLPIGVIAGKRSFMDALDGGFWQFGDASVPEVGVTYFAGTFVRHPLALAAACATLRQLKAEGPQLQAKLNEQTKALADELNQLFLNSGAPFEIRHFCSIWKTFVTGDHPHADLLFYLLRERGIHIYDGFPCFLTAAHSAVDLRQVVEAFRTAVAELQEGEFIPGRPASEGVAASFDASSPPVPGARLGRDRDGTPAWFAPHPAAPGRYVKVGSP